MFRAPSRLLVVVPVLLVALSGCGYSSPLLYRSAPAAERAIVGLPIQGLRFRHRVVVRRARCFIGPQQCEVRLSNHLRVACVIGLTTDERHVQSLLCALAKPGVPLF